MSGRDFLETITMQNAAAGTGDGASLQVGGSSTAGLQISGTFVATVAFEATIDGTNWIALSMTPVAGGAAVTSATAPGLFLANVAGLKLIRARVSAFTSGTVTVIGTSTTAVR